MPRYSRRRPVSRSRAARRRLLWTAGVASESFTAAGSAATVVATPADWQGTFNESFERAMFMGAIVDSVAWPLSPQGAEVQGLLRWSLGFFRKGEAVPSSIFTQMSEEDLVAYGQIIIGASIGTSNGYAFMSEGVKHRVKVKRQVDTNTELVLSWQCTNYVGAQSDTIEAVALIRSLWRPGGG